MPAALTMDCAAIGVEREIISAKAGKEGGAANAAPPFVCVNMPWFVRGLVFAAA